MAENVNKDKAGAPAVAPVKKRRRGVSNETRSVTQLKFHEKDMANNGLFVGHLDNVSVEYSINADGKQFTGMSMPRLSLHFASNHPKEDERRHLIHSIFPVESNVNTIPNGDEEWKVNTVFAWVKHLLDVLYLRGRAFTEEEEDALTLDFEDYDENGQYIPVDPQEVLDGYAKLFNNVAAMLNGRFNLPEGETPKPCYKTANGGLVPLWMKLLRHKKRKNEWVNVGNNGDLDFDQFIGSGVIELYVQGKDPVHLRIDRAKESVTPKEVKKTPTIGVPSMGAVPIPEGGMGMPMDNGAALQAGEEMPF